MSNGSSESYTTNGRTPWKGMTPVKRYRDFTLFYKKAPGGEIYAECFLNWEIDRKGRV